MISKLTEEQIYEEAKKRVKAKKDFYVHLSVYICVNAFLVIIWAVQTPGGFPWFIFPMGGWGIGIVFHGLEVFFFSRRGDRSAVEREAEKIRKAQG